MGQARRLNAEAFFEEVRRLLNERGLTGKWLAEQLGLEPSSVSKWFAGVSRPDLAETAWAIEELLDLPAWTLRGILFNEQTPPAVNVRTELRHLLRHDPLISGRQRQLLLDMYDQMRGDLKSDPAGGEP